MLSFNAALTRLTTVMHEQRRSPRTILEYRNILRRLHDERGVIASVPALRLMLGQWRAATLQQLEDGAISASKIRNEHSAFRALYDVLVSDGALDVNPARDHRLLPRDGWTPRPIPLADVEKLMLACDPVVDGKLDATRLRDRAILELCYNGLRNSEVCSLTLDRIAWHREEQTLVLRVLGKGNTQNPGGKERTVPLAPQSAEVLGLYLLHRFAPNEAAAWVQEIRQRLDPRDELQAVPLAVDRLLRSRDDHRRVFSVTRWLLNGRDQPRRPVEGPLLVRENDRIFAKYRALAQLPAAYKPHALRHSCATLLLERNVDLKKIADLLGHSSVVTTQIYTKVTVSAAAAAMRHLPASGKRVLV